MEPRSSLQFSATTTVAPSRPRTVAGPSQAAQFWGGSAHSFTPRKIEDESQNDSGYGSQDSSQVATPDQPGVNDSGNPPRERGLELCLSKTKTLIAFNYGIDQASATRFYSIQPSIESLLLQYTRRKSLLRSSSRHKPMAIRLMFLGKTELEATPHIVVFCAPDMRRRVQHFFDTDEVVKAFYKPEDTSLPSFDVAVCGTTPQLRNGETSVEAICDMIGDTEATSRDMYKTTFDNTFCGTPILLQANGKSGKATLGGLVKLQHSNGEFKLYGLTAGHVVKACLENEEEDEGIEADDADSIDSLPSDSDSDWSQSESEDTNDEDPDSGSTPTKVANDNNDSESWNFEHPKTLGGVFSHGDSDRHGKQSSRGSSDWALVELNHYKQNRLPAFMFRENLNQWHVGITKYLTQSPAVSTTSLTEGRVILMCGSSGPKFGYLTSQPARILIGSSSTFVDAYMIVPDGGNAIVDGDSGSWVVTEDGHQVVGHVVATDALGAGYIIPLCDIFSDIQQKLGVVSLPSVNDITLAAPKTVRFEGSTRTSHQWAQAGPHQTIYEEEESQNPEENPLLPPQRPAAPVNVGAIMHHSDPVSPYTLARPPTPDENGLVHYIPMQQGGDQQGGDQKSRPRPWFPTPPSSNEAMDRERRNRRARDSVYVNGQRVFDMDGDVNRRSRNKDSRGERVVIVDNTRASSRMSYSSAASSKDGSVSSHDSGYSSHGGSSRSSPNYSTSALPVDPRQTSHDRTSGILIAGRRPGEPVFYDPEERIRRREAKIAAANAAIAAREPVPLSSQHHRIPMKETMEMEIWRETDPISALNAALRRTDIDSETRSRQSRIGMASDMKLIGYGDEDAQDIKEGRMKSREEEEEAQKQRLRERMMPKRRATVGPGHRRRVVYDDGTYRWE